VVPPDLPLEQKEKIQEKKPDLRIILPNILPANGKTKISYLFAAGGRLHACFPGDSFKIWQLFENSLELLQEIKVPRPYYYMLATLISLFSFNTQLDSLKGVPNCVMDELGERLFIATETSLVAWDPTTGQVLEKVTTVGTRAVAYFDRAVYLGYISQQPPSFRGWSSSHANDFRL